MNIKSLFVVSLLLSLPFFAYSVVYQGTYDFSSSNATVMVSTSTNLLAPVNNQSLNSNLSSVATNIASLSNSVVSLSTDATALSNTVMTLTTSWLYVSVPDASTNSLPSSSRYISYDETNIYFGASNIGGSGTNWVRVAFTNW
jgi:outer membrane receptor for ferrienterochelin and colicin